MPIALRVKIEALLAVLAAGLAVLAWLDPAWIESLFDATPDAGSGEVEWGLALAFALASAAFALVGGIEWRRLQQLRRAG